MVMFVCDFTFRRMLTLAVIYTHVKTRAHLLKVLYLSFDGHSARNDRISSWAPSSFTYFLLFSQHQHTYSDTHTHPFTNFPTVNECVCVHPAAECVCHSVLLQGREGEACLFQGTPPELMFHTCAQRGTLYRASQVHCINCERNHFIGRRGGCAGGGGAGVLLHHHLRLLFSGMHSITQYSHLNCF